LSSDRSVFIILKRRGPRVNIAQRKGSAPRNEKGKAEVFALLHRLTTSTTGHPPWTGWEEKERREAKSV